MANKNITNRGYYLGVGRETGLKYYLQKPKFECGWYWSFDYIVGYEPRHKECAEFLSWEAVVDIYGQNAFEAMNCLIDKPSLSEKSCWLLCDYMKSCYTLKAMADLCYSGNSHYIETPNISFKDETLNNKINKELLPKLFKEIEKLFLEEDGGPKLTDRQKGGEFN